jgi:hypothetical protein
MENCFDKTIIFGFFFALFMHLKVKVANSLKFINSDLNELVLSGFDLKKAKNSEIGGYRFLTRKKSAYDFFCRLSDQKIVIEAFESKHFFYNRSNPFEREKNSTHNS